MESRVREREELRALPARRLRAPRPRGLLPVDGREASRLLLQPRPGRLGGDSLDRPSRRARGLRDGRPRPPPSRHRAGVPGRGLLRRAAPGGGHRPGPAGEEPARGVVGGGRGGHVEPPAAGAAARACGQRVPAGPGDRGERHRTRHGRRSGARGDRGEVAPRGHRGPIHVHGGSARAREGRAHRDPTDRARDPPGGPALRDADPALRSLPRRGAGPLGLHRPERAPGTGRTRDSTRALSSRPRSPRPHAATTSSCTRRAGRRAVASGSACCVCWRGSGFASASTLSTSTGSSWKSSRACAGDARRSAYED